jgi:uncharacterized protein (DUF1501 family)
MLMLSRRAFLKSSTLLALAPTIPSFLAGTARAAKSQTDSRVLVVIELNGGNDGINTVVPFGDEGYAKNRQTLRLPKDRLLKVTDQVGLNPALGDFGKLLDSSRLSVIQGVGYPNPNRSHPESMAIWQTARFTKEEQKCHGWLGRALDQVDRPASTSPAALHVGTESLPAALQGRRTVVSALAQLEDYEANIQGPLRRAIAGPEAKDDLTAYIRRTLLDGYLTADSLKEVASGQRTAIAYPETGLAQRLELIARVLKAGMGTRIFYTIQSGYDTHYSQLPRHANLLGELAGAQKAFLDDLAATGLGDRVAVLTFSEFGRRVQENASAGTDHGTAGPVFLAGPKVRSGLAGTTPPLLDLEDGDLKMGIDFRRVYATVLEDWLGLTASDALGGDFAKLPLFSLNP